MNLLAFSYYTYGGEVPEPTNYEDMVIAACVAVIVSCALAITSR